MRRVQKIMNDWMFTNQGKKRPVDLPHTWNALDGQDGGNDYWRGTNKYDTVFSTPEFDKETQRVYLQFHGVNASAKVILNGKEVCNRDGGYATFRMDVTEILEDENKKLHISRSYVSRIEKAALLKQKTKFPRNLIRLKNKAYNFLLTFLVYPKHL